MGRYLRLFAAFARFGLAGEMAFRANFIVKLLVEFLWLVILLVFYDLLFSNTRQIATWDRNQYLFFVGCHYALGGLIETFFLENCTGFAELVRSGELDQYLLKPIDEQFLITCRHVDWSTLPNIVQGVAVMLYALWMLGWPVAAWQVLAFLILFFCGAAMAYSFLLMLCSMSVYMVRNQSLIEMWWLFTTLMRYPREIFFTNYWASPIGFVFTYILPVLLIVYVPAGVMVRALDPALVAVVVAAALVLLYLSRLVFRQALRSYRSASS
jgi:ABC-2 type transport system permease protein